MVDANGPDSPSIYALQFTYTHTFNLCLMFVRWVNITRQASEHPCDARAHFVVFKIKRSQYLQTKYMRKESNEDSGNCV